MTSHQKIGFLSKSLTYWTPREELFYCYNFSTDNPILLRPLAPDTLLFFVQHKGFRLFPQTSLICDLGPSQSQQPHHPPASACHPASTAYDAIALPINTPISALRQSCTACCYAAYRSLQHHGPSSSTMPQRPTRCYRLHDTRRSRPPLVFLRLGPAASAVLSCFVTGLCAPIPKL